jgi:hypothetical protein
MKRRAALLLAAAFTLGAQEAEFRESPGPWADRVYPLSVTRGATVEVEVHGRYLANTAGMAFDTKDIEWIETRSTSSAKVTGVLRVAPDAALGPHVLQLTGPDGPSNSRVINVTQFSAVLEAEPNDRRPQAQSIELRPQSIQGYLKGQADIDLYTFEARAGERWSFDLRSLEYGAHLECEMALLDAEGHEVAFNDDQDDYDETPLLEHVFERPGRYYLMIQQYRGPQGVDCGQNCGYSLEVSQLPRILALTPLGARTGSTVQVELSGHALDTVEEVWLTKVRGAEYYRMTYPFTMPIRFEADPEHARDIPRIPGRVLERDSGRAAVSLAIPPDAATGLWRLWARTPYGIAEGLNFEISGTPELYEAEARAQTWRGGDLVVNGRLDREREEDIYLLQVEAGKPLLISTLATQLGLPFIDTVLELRDPGGRVIAEHDDIMTGQGTVIGNPDSSLYYVPEKSGPLELIVRDRTWRGGLTYSYRLRLSNRRPGFQLLSAPENFVVARGTSATLTVFLIPDPGFQGPVSVRVEGLPPGVQAPQGSFRADQAFRPSDDGDNILIPDLPLEFRIPASVPPGSYPIRILGQAEPGGEPVLAHTSLWIGPPRNRNDLRRPRPHVALTVTEPFAARLDAKTASLRLASGETTELELETEAIPEDAPIRLGNAPAGVTTRVAQRENGRLVLSLQAAPDAPPASALVSAEARVQGRWAATFPITLTIGPAAADRASR